MTLILDVKPETAQRIEKAKAQGIDMDAFLCGALDQLSPESESPQESLTYGARLLAEMEQEGILGLWQDRPEDSSELAREWRRQAETRGADA